MDINKFLDRTFSPRVIEGLGVYQDTRPRIHCKNGFTMSVQASEHTYCTPRSTGLLQYTRAEVGFPSEKEDALMDYAEDADDPTNTVYGWVPVAVINEVIEKHGGIDEEKTFKEKK